MSDLSVELPGGRVVFTDRADGDLRAAAGRRRLAERLGVHSLLHGRQVHGAVVRRAGMADVEASGGEADGQATARRGEAAMVLVADCLPVMLAAEGAVAALHGGWRGLAGGIVDEGVAAVRELGASGPITAVLGPSARGCCYEVGEEVHAVFAAHGARRGERKLDLAAVAVAQLHAAGVDQVLDIERCTMCEPRFFSHRRERERAGRQAGVVWRT